MKGKRGWIRILEVTVAILIVSGTMLAVYSQQPVPGGVSVSEYAYGVQNQILDDVASNRSLRLEVLNVSVDRPGDTSYDKLDVFVESKISDSFGYLLRVCDLGSDSDYCKMDSVTFIATKDKDIFTEEIVVSAELGNGSGMEVYSPKKVRLFFWEGKLPEGGSSVGTDFCVDECSSDLLFCSEGNVMTKKCEYVDYCLEYGSEDVEEVCDSGRTCEDGACASVGGNFSLVCEAIIHDLSSPPNACRDENSGIISPSSWCSLDCDNVVECSDGKINCDCFGPCSSVGTPADCGFDVEKTVMCSMDPVCPDGYSEVSRVSCVLGAAVLSVEYDLGEKIGNKYYYDVTLTESSGVDVTIDSGERCFPRTTGKCFDYSPSFVIPASGVMIRSNQFFDTTETLDMATYTYYGIDANSNSVEINFSISTEEYA